MAEKIGGSKINQPFVSNYSLSTTPANPISEKKDYYSEAESNKINDKNNSEESSLENYENKETKKYADKIKSIVLSDKSSSDEKKNNSDESSKSSSNEDGYDDGEKTTDSEKKD